MKRLTEDYKIPSMNLHGMYRGVVEDRNDPKKMGRVRVRVFGVHTEQKTKDDFNGIPTEELPWATPANPLFEGSIAGFGSWSVPLQGSHVFVFFENGHINNPVYFATSPGLPTEKPDTTKGFNDPDGVYPHDDRLNEPDVHRLARAEKVEDGTIVKFKSDNLDKGVPQADDNTWDEPEPAYKAEYPDNIVLSTHKGITIELDNTNDNERIHIFHPSNSYIEIDVDGNMVIRNNKDKYEITIGGKFIHIKEDFNETIDRNKTKYVKQNEISKIDQNQKETIGKDVTRDIVGNLSDTIDGNVTESVGGDHKEDITGNLNITVGGDCNITVTGQCNITADNVYIDGNSGGGHLDGIVTGDCLCAFTGKPHIQKSSNVKGTL